MALDADEMQAYETRGHAYLTELADRIQYSAPGVAGSASPYAARNLSTSDGARVNGVTIEWIKARDRAPIRRTASCCCGQLRVVTHEEPLRVSVCHCLNCQRRSGSVFAAQARFRREAVEVSGSSAAYVRAGDSGGKATFHFCPTCGTTVYYRPEAFPDFVIVPVGVFADPTFPAPTVCVYESRQHAWVRMSDDIEYLT